MGIMLAERSEVYNLTGQSFAEALFAKKTLLEETIDIWMAQMLKVVEEEKREVFATMLKNDGVLREKDMMRFKTKVRDVLTWLWINSFIAGDRETGEEIKFAQNESDVAEFAEKSLNETSIYNWLEKYEDLLFEYEDNKNNKELLQKIKKRQPTFEKLKTKLAKDLQETNINYKKSINNKNLTFEEQRKIADRLTDLEALNQSFRQIELDYKIAGKSRKIQSLDRIAPKEPVVKTPKPPKQKPTFQPPTDDELEKRLKRKFKDDERGDVKDAILRLRNLRNKQKTTGLDYAEPNANTFIEESDFGRIYLQTRNEYIAKTYAGTTQEKMLNVFAQMNNDYLKKERKQTAPIQQYFERLSMRKTESGERIGGIPLQTRGEGKAKIDGVEITLPGVRVFPKATENLNKMREVKLYEDAKKQYVDLKEDKDIKSLRRIVETEVVAAFNMGRLHSMYANGVKLVRWVNDAENRRDGKVCKICSIRALGTSPKLRKLDLKESLSGVYTLEEAMTDRQLAIPSHPYCQCVLRPLTRDEERQLAVMGGALIQDSVVQTAAAVGIATASVEGVSRVAGANDETDRSRWWYGAAMVGGAAVAIGAAYFYLRKSLTARYAANLMKQRGRSIVQTVDEKGLVKGLTVPDQTTLDQSLRLADDVGIEGGTTQPLKPTKEQIIKYPEWEADLPKLEDLSKIKRDLVEDLTTRSAIENTLVDQTYRGFHGSTINNEVLEANLRERKIDLKRLEQTLESAYDAGDETTKPFLARTIIENQRAINRTDRMLSKINDRPVRAVQEGMMPRDELRTFFDELEPIDLNTTMVDLELDGKPFSTKIREVSQLNIVKRFAEEGDVSKDIVYLQKVAKRLRKQEDISPVDFQRLQRRLRKIERDRAITELALTRAGSGTTVFNDIDVYVRDGMEDVLGNNTMRIYNKNKTHKTLINEVSRKLYKLKADTPTYAQKLVDENKTDPFVKNININSSTVKTNAIKGRENAVKTIDALLSDLRKPGVSEKTINDLLDLQSMQDVFADRKYTLDSFKQLDKTEQRKLLRKWKTELMNEANRIRTAEFSRFQKKWAMFGAPK